VAQDAAWRQGTLLRNAGRADAALAAVKRGLGRSSANTAYRSNLLVLEGDLLTARGDAAGAAKAWAEAARLNGER
jgi:predicted negative regulator of RcsB-dependent stress response